MSTLLTIAGRTLLVVEDEYLTAFSLVMSLEDAGAKIVGPVSNPAGAREAMSKAPVPPEAAILDINLHGEMIYPFARELQAQKIPIVFVTGYEPDTMPIEFRTIPCLSKPCDEHELIAILASMLEGSSNADQ